MKKLTLWFYLASDVYDCEEAVLGRFRRVKDALRVLVGKAIHHFKHAWEHA